MKGRKRREDETPYSLAHSSGRQRRVHQLEQTPVCDLDWEQTPICVLNWLTNRVSILPQKSKTAVFGYSQLMTKVLSVKTVYT